MPAFKRHGPINLRELDRGGQVASYLRTLGGKHTLTGEATFLLDRQLTKRWYTLVEYAGGFP